MTTEIQQNRYDMLLRRVCGQIGPGSRVSESLSELFPMIDVENVPGELLLLMGTRLCMGGGQAGPTATNAPKVQLFNPADSGMLLTITRVTFSVSAVAVHRWGRSTAVFAGSRSGTEEFIDSRNPIANVPVGEIRFLDVVPLANASSQLRLNGNVDINLQNDNGIYVLAPGTGFEIGSSVVNTIAFVGFNWRERVAEQSELNL